MKGTKILYVEDEPFLGKIVKESLERKGYEVKMLTDGRGVLEEYKAYRPDICVFDIMLPHKDGYTLAEEVRGEDEFIPIIFLTAKSQTEDVLKGFSSGGNDYIRKPFSVEELNARIKNLLEMRENAPETDPEEASVIQLGSYHFDPRKYELSRAGEKRRLSHRETELLRILAEHKDAAIERQTILKEIWGDDSFFNSRNLDVYITKLRSYLKEDPNVRIITLKGVGYQFVVD